jgi:type I restriction enzyme S subunit
MLNLNTKILRSVPISYPKISEQQQIAEMLLNIDIKIVAEEDRKLVLQAFFKSMLHQLMTGQLRLLSDEGLPL